MTLEPKAWLWYISSFALLWFMLALRFSPLWLRVGMATLGLLCVHYVAFVLKRNSDERPSNNKLTIVGDAGTDAAAYIAAYLLPLFAVADPSANDLLVYALFLVATGTVHVRSGLMQGNPTVYFMKRRMLRATLPVRGIDKEVFVISHRDLRVASEINAERVSDRLYIYHAAQPAT